jgi:hypothetical protein
VSCRWCATPKFVEILTEEPEHSVSGA